MAKNSPPLCADQVREALERIALNCVIKGYILPYTNKVAGSQLHKKPYVSELLFLTLQPKEHSFKIVKEAVCIIFFFFLIFKTLLPRRHPSPSHCVFCT